MKNFDSNLFCERAKELFGKTGQQELSQKIGISQAVISAIKNNSAKSPSADTIYLISKKFGVSADWLLGLSDIKSADKDTHALCAALGLSENTVKLLSEAKDKYTVTAFNWLVEQHLGKENQHKVLEIYKEIATENRIPFKNERSIIWNIAQMAEMEKTKANDIQFFVDDTENGKFSATFYSDDKVSYQIEQENCFCNSNTFMHYFSFSEVLAQQFCNNINRIFSNFAKEITNSKAACNIKTFLSECNGISKEALKFLIEFADEGEPNGNNKKEE